MNKTWSFKQAVKRLGVNHVPFDHDLIEQGVVPERAQGYSINFDLALRSEDDPLVALHELAHIVIGHTNTIRGMLLPPVVGEIEAQAAALALTDLLDVDPVSVSGEDGHKYLLDYVSVWEPEMGAPDARRVKRAAAAILKAGMGDEWEISMGIDGTDFSLT